MKAIIKVDVPEWQIGQEVSLYFPDTMNAKGICEKEKIGKWINRRIITKNKSFDMYVCSNCNEEYSYDAETGIEMSNYKFCPNCGAKMEN